MIHMTISVPTSYGRSKAVCRCDWESEMDYPSLNETWKAGDAHLAEANR